MRALIAIQPDFKWTLTDIFETGSQVAAERTWTATNASFFRRGPPDSATK